MRQSWYALVLVMGLGSVAAAGEKAANTGLEALAKSLDATDRQDGSVIASTLKNSLLLFKEAPKIHTRAFASKVENVEDRKRMLEQTAAMEQILLRIGGFAESLSRAEDTAFEDAMRSLVELRDRLAGPGSYGNIIVGLGITQYVGRLSLHRIFDKHGEARALAPILARNQQGAMPQWEVLAKSLEEETKGVVQLKLKAQAPLRERLMELLREAKRLGDAVNFEAAERDGPCSAALDVLMSEEKLMMSFIPESLDRVFLSGLLVNMALAERMASSGAWWSLWAQSHSKIPTQLGEFEKEYAANTQAQGIGNTTSLGTGKPYKASDLYGVWQIRELLVDVAMLSLTGGPWMQSKPK